MLNVSAIIQNKMHFILGFKWHVFAIAVSKKNAVFGALTPCGFVDRSKVWEEPDASSS
jgi:hypothetical protein